MRNRELKLALVNTLPVVAGYLVMGFGFGVLLIARGYPVFWALLMSVFIYAGSMQFVTIDMLVGGASLATAALMTLLINARHLFYGISMLDKYRNTGRAKPYLIFALTDETYSVLLAQEPPEGYDSKRYYLYVSALSQCYWVLGSMLGAVAGRVMSINLKGIEYSMTALFVVVMVEQWLQSRNRLPAVVGLGCSLVSLLLFGPANFIPPAMGLMLVLLALLRPQMEEGGLRA